MSIIMLLGLNYDDSTVSQVEFIILIFRMVFCDNSICRNPSTLFESFQAVYSVIGGVAGHPNLMRGELPKFQRQLF